MPFADKFDDTPLGQRKRAEYLRNVREGNIRPAMKLVPNVERILI